LSVFYDIFELKISSFCEEDMSAGIELDITRMLADVIGQDNGV